MKKSLSKDVVPAQTLENFFELNLYGRTIDGQVCWQVDDLERTMIDLK